MADSLFNIFGDHVTKQALKTISRQPLSNIENMGKSVSTGPLKPNEPIKTGTHKKGSETKKSFLSNTGKVHQSTPNRMVFTPRAVNVRSMIYSDDGGKDECFEEIEFTKPKYIYDNFQTDLFDYLPLSEPEMFKQRSAPNTPPPATQRHSMEFDCSYQDEFFTDDFSNESIPEEDDLNLPDLY